MSEAELTNINFRTFSSACRSGATATQRQRHGDAKRLGGLEVDDQLDFGGPLDRQVGRFLTLEDATGIVANETVGVHAIASVAHHPAGESELAVLIDRGHAVSER